MGVRQTAGYVEARVDMRALCFVIPLQDAKLPSRHDLCLGSSVKKRRINGGYYDRGDHGGCNAY